MMRRWSPQPCVVFFHTVLMVLIQVWRKFVSCIYGLLSGKVLPRYTETVLQDSDLCNQVIKSTSLF
jgi:hypothetical protein